MDNFEFCCLNLKILLNYLLYFGSYNVVEGVVAENWVETERTWVEVDGTDLGVHSLAMPFNLTSALQHN